jgi:hypothetical protein
MTAGISQNPEEYKEFLEAVTTHSILCISKDQSRDVINEVKKKIEHAHGIHSSR